MFDSPQIIWLLLDGTNLGLTEIDIKGGKRIGKDPQVGYKDRAKETHRYQKLYTKYAQFPPQRYHWPYYIPIRGKKKRALEIKNAAKTELEKENLRSNEEI